MGRGCLVKVEYEDLVRFIEHEDSWPAWNPDRITDSALREWAGELRRGLRFYTTTQAAPILAITPLGLQKAIREGRVKAIKCGPNWYIRSDWLKPMGQTKRPQAGRRSLAPEDLVVIADRWGKVPVVEIAASLGFGRSATVHKHAKRLGLPPIGRGYWKIVRAHQKATGAAT